MQRGVKQVEIERIGQQGAQPSGLPCAPRTKHKATLTSEIEKSSYSFHFWTQYGICDSILSLSERMEVNNSRLVCCQHPVNVALTEFLCGPLEQRDMALARSIISELRPFNSEMCDLAASLFNDAGRRRGSLQRRSLNMHRLQLAIKLILLPSDHLDSFSRRVRKH